MTVLRRACRAIYAVDMSEPAPELDPEDALRGVINQLTIRGQRMPVIIPGSIIETLLFVSGLVDRARGAGYLPDLMRHAMPWTAPLAGEELDQLASDISEAASSGDHAPERLAAVLREWRETAEILSQPGVLEELAAARAEIDRGDFLRGAKAIEAMRHRR